MRYAWLGVVLLGCSSESSEPPDAGVDASSDVALEVPVDAPSLPGCGDEPTLPAGVTKVDDHGLAVACEKTTLGVSVLDEGIVRLKYGKGPEPLVPVERPVGPAVVAGRRGSTLVVCTSTFEVSIAAKTCALTVKDATGTLLEDRDGWFEKDGAVGVSRKLATGERVYGLGQHTTHRLDLRGASIDLWNTDAYVDANKGYPPDAKNLYQSIPFYVALRDARAYGVFTHDTHRMHFDVGTTDGELRVTGTAMDQYLIPGPAIREVVRRYGRLTGRMPMPAPWTLGFHQSRWEGPCDGAPSDKPFCSASQIVDLAKRLRAEKIPADGVFLDIQHMRGFRTFTFDPTRFADPIDLTSKLAALGFHTHAIVDPGLKVDDGWDVYKAGFDGGFYLSDASGIPFKGEVWPGAAVFPDFSAKKTRDWWAGLSLGMADKGLSGLWIDMNEPSNFVGGTVPNTLACDGDGRKTTMAELHNAYAYYEAKATYEGMRAKLERPFLLSRAAFAGSQKYTAVWTGDAPSTWSTLQLTLPMLLHLGLSGMAFAGSDVGGYSGREESTPELFSRWMALGSVSPFFRAHAEKDAKRQEPWSFGPEAEDATRDFIGARYERMPYLYSLFHEASESGAPVLRPLVFEFQDDPKAQVTSDEAMVGPFLLVAPVLAKSDRTRAVYLPAGTWLEWSSGARFSGTATLSTDPEPFPLDALPTFVREGAIVPHTVRRQHMGESPDAPLFLDVFPGPKPSAFTLYEDDGEKSSAKTTLTLEPTADGARFAAKRSGTYAPKHEKIVVRLRGADGTVTGVKLDGKPVSFTHPDREVLVELSDRGEFTLEFAYDKAPQPNGTVKIPLTVNVPAGTPTTTAIHVASSATAWTHTPLTRIGDVATGTLEVPRAGWFFYKITRGAWPTVEKDPTCAERTNRHGFGTPGAITVNVAAWADKCP